MTDMEDRCRRNNVKTGGAPRRMRGPDAAGFLRANLSKWIPSLRGRDIEIDRAHRVYDGGRGSDRPRTLIFRVLRWHDRSDILKLLGRLIRWNAHRAMSHCYFFLTLVRLQRSGERHLVRFEEDDCTWSPALPHLYGGKLSYGNKGEQRSYDFPAESGGFYQLPVSAADVGRCSAEGQRGSSSRCFSSSTEGAWRPGWTWP